MSEPESPPPRRKIPRNIWALSGTSFFMDVSSEMILNVLPLFLANVLGVGTAVIGLIDLPASLIAGVLWQGIGTWPGFGPAAPFYFGAATALVAALLFTAFVRET